jgi:hypothetical protein
MEQQRTRRHKTILPNNQTKSQWSTSNITPGTRFMEKLSQKVHDAFYQKEKKYQVESMVVSTSNDPGEGEHKLFEHMRERNKSTNTKNEMSAIYGLDSDLIMLSIFHCRMFKNIYIFREETEFMKTSISLPKPKHQQLMFCYFMDIDALGKGIMREMKCKFPDEKRIYDYVFLCFFLGNDFLPHFPALNIRTQGIDILLETYRRIVGQYSDRFFIEDDLEIQWKWVRKWIQDLAEKEHEYLLAEYQVRNKWNKYSWKTDTDENKDIVLQSVPVIYRGDEHYICPTEKGWEQRYYNCLFKSANTRTICTNYLEGLEWVFCYYSKGCSHWRWKYNYHYPPLLSDLIRFVPEKDTRLLESEPTRPFLPIIQLMYVLPRSNHSLLPDLVGEKCKTYAEYYPEEFEYQWTFCRYLWEAHVKLPEIPISMLEKWEQEVKTKHLQKVERSN